MTQTGILHWRARKKRCVTDAQDHQQWVQYSWKVNKEKSCSHLNYRITSSPVCMLLLIFMYDDIILTQNQAIGACPPTLAVDVPIASFWVRIVTYSCINIKRGVLCVFLYSKFVSVFVCLQKFNLKFTRFMRD